MINIDSYIASGILEDYLAGILNEAETKEVETQLELYPSLRLELDELSIALEGLAQNGAVSPPSSVKQKLLSQLDFAAEEVVTATQTAPKVIPLVPMRKVWWAVAAAVVLLPLASVFYMQQEQHRQAELDRLAEESYFATRQAEVTQPTNVESFVVSLKSEDALSTTSAMLIWKPTSGEVTLNVQYLPSLSASKHYVLWSNTGVAYKNLGMVSEKQGQYNMGKTEKAELFLITEETQKAATQPSLNKVVIKGVVK